MSLTKTKRLDSRKLARAVHCFLRRFRAVTLRTLYSLNTVSKRKICVFGIWKRTNLYRNCLTWISSLQLKHLSGLDLLCTLGGMKSVKRLHVTSTKQFSVCQKVTGRTPAALEHILKCKFSTYWDLYPRKKTSWSSINIKKSFSKPL